MVAESSSHPWLMIGRIVSNAAHSQLTSDVNVAFAADFSCGFDLLDTLFVALPWCTTITIGTLVSSLSLTVSPTHIVGIGSGPPDSPVNTLNLCPRTTSRPLLKALFVNVITARSLAPYYFLGVGFERHEANWAVAIYGFAV